MDCKDFIIENWKNPSQLQKLIGQECNQSFSFNFGDIPTDKAEVDVKDNKISRIRTYSGFSWSARYGYGNVTCDVS